jgi:hypothetical protein
MRKFIPVLIFFILSLIPLLWIPRSLGREFMGSGDYLSPANTRKEIADLFSVYNPHQMGGFDDSLEIGAFIPYWFIMLVTNSVSIPAPAGTMIYISFSIFVAEICMYLWLKHQLKTGQSVEFFRISGAVIFAFSPYLPVYVAPGQMGNYSLYAILPLIFLLSDIILKTRIPDFKYYLAAFFLFAFATNGGSYGIGPLYVIIWAVVPYCLLNMLIYRIKFILFVKKVSLIILLLFISNIYWLLPWIFVGVSQTTKLGSNTITSAIAAASHFASVSGLLLGRGSGLEYLSGIQNLPVMLLFLILVSGLIAGFYLIGKNKQFITATGMLLFSLFIVKGSNPPFSGLFFWIYNNFPGFSVFRRPINKFSGVYLIFLITAGFLGYIAFENKFPKYRTEIFKITSMILTIGVIGLVITFASHKYFAYFSVPDYYKQTWKNISSVSPTRILLLPGLSGIQPTFGTELDSYHGFDFLNKIWDASIIYPDFTDYSPNYPVKSKTNDLVMAILKKTNACELLGQTGVSHILIRRDLAPTAYFEINPGLYSEKTSLSGVSTGLKQFGSKAGGLDLYEIKPECRKPLVFAESQNGAVKSRVTQITDTKKTVSFSEIPADFSLKFLENYSGWWKLIPGDLSRNSWLADMLLLFNPSVFGQSHGQAYGWANEWNVTGNKSGIYTLYYLPQSAVSLGIILWTVFTGLIFAYEIIIQRKK